MKKTLLALGSVAILCSALVNMESAADPRHMANIISEARQSAQNESTLITGRFVLESGEPIPNVSMIADQEIKITNPSVTITNREHIWGNDDGTFSISVGRGEKSALLIRHKDFVLKTVLIKEQEDAREEIALGDIVLQNGFRPTIQVLDQNDEPVNDVWVQLLITVSQADLDSQTQTPVSFVDPEYALTNAQGYATFGPVEPGHYTVSIVEKPNGWPFRTQHEGVADRVFDRTQIDSLAKPVKGVYKTTRVELSRTLRAVTILAEKTVNVTVQFSDKQTTPDREQQISIIGGETLIPIVNGVVVVHSNYRGKHIGEGKFLFEVPERLADAQLQLKEDNRFLPPRAISNELSYRCMIDGKEVIPPIYPQHFPLGILDGDKNVEIICYRSPKITLHVVDEAGVPVQEYFAAAQYLRRGEQTVTVTQDTDAGTVTVDGWPQRAVRFTWYWAHALLATGIAFDADVVFAWRDFGTDAARMNYEGILPDEELCLYVIGRGYEVVERVIPKMAEGEERELTITLTQRLETE